MNFSKLLHIAYDRDRIYGLDILRAIAVLFVVLIHSAYLLPPNMAKMLAHFILDGVSIFFVLSGFLIGGILIRLLETERATISTLFKFWMRRWLRTLPAYYFVLIVLVLLPAVYTHYSSWHETLKYFFFAQNIYLPHPPFFPEAWSISVEEWFYLVAPVMIFLIIAILRLSAKNAVILIAITVICLTIAFRYHIFLSNTIHSTKDWDLMIGKLVVTRVDSVMVGVLGAYISCYYQTLWTKYKTPLLILGIILLLSMKLVTEVRFPYKRFLLSVPYFTITAVGTLFLLPYLSGLRSGKGVVFRFFTFISLISYSMYLLNLSIVQEFLLRQIDFYHYKGVFLLLRYILYWVFTVVGAIILYKSIEKPFMDMRQGLV